MKSVRFSTFIKTKYNEFRNFCQMRTETDMLEIEYETLKQLIDNWAVYVDKARRADGHNQPANRTIAERDAILKELRRKAGKPIKVKC